MIGLVGCVKSKLEHRVLARDPYTSQWEDGELEISVENVGYRSAFIGAVLSTIPGAMVTAAPRRIRLRTTAR